MHAAAWPSASVASKALVTELLSGALPDVRAVL